MRLLLDTHIFLWCIADDKRLSKEMRSTIVNAEEVYVSSASIWEMAIKIKLGKLKSNVAKLVAAIDESGFLELPITAKHAETVFSLPDIHKDPFDRMLVAQALTEPLLFFTADTLLTKYSELVRLTK